MVAVLKQFWILSCILVAAYTFFAKSLSFKIFPWQNWGVKRGERYEVANQDAQEIKALSLQLDFQHSPAAGEVAQFPRELFSGRWIILENVKSQVSKHGSS